AGRHIQLKLFPERGREIDGLQFDHLIKPSLYLSGDFLDYFQIDERNVVFYLADVSGHGASSAFVTVLLKNLTNRLQRNLRRGSKIGRASCREREGISDVEDGVKDKCAGRSEVVVCNVAL